MVIVVEMACGHLAGGQPWQFRSIHNENVGPAVVVVIENLHAGTRGLAAENHPDGNPRFASNVAEVGDRCERLAQAAVGALRCKRARGGTKRRVQTNRQSEETRKATDPQGYDVR